MKVRLFNVKFSPNLGDGLLAECLEAELIRLGADRDTWSIDLAGRTGPGTGIRSRGRLLAILQASPAPLRRLLARGALAVMVRRKWRPHYAAGLAGADTVIVGGGNLFSDRDLNFPVKLHAALDEAGRHALSAAVFGVGVSRQWSAAGLRLFRDAVQAVPLSSVQVRDAASKRAWDDTLAEVSGHEAAICRDPGLLASDFFPRPEPSAGDTPVIGVGIMSPLAVRYHADDAPTPAQIDRWYLDLVRGLTDTGLRVSLFTNGSPEDEAYLRSLKPSVAEAAPAALLTWPEASTPAGLCRIVGGLDGLVAFRMHALIAAHSYRVPTIGLAWDPKLEAFMESVDRADHLLTIPTDPAQRAVALARDGLTRGIPIDRHRAVLAETRLGVQRLFDALPGVAEPDLRMAAHGG